ncbi:MAG: polymerase sigma-54 factor RpoN [Myxococcaceae bacterium]|nr:polymerase sigma-54 factor RpoN [Myxococcaceae bacterium]
MMKRSLRLVPPAPATSVAAASNDADVLGRVGRGDVGALGELYDRHASALLGFATRCTSAQDAEDLVQTTFVRAARAAATFDGRAGSARSWLFGITAHLVQERRRSFARLARALLRFDVGAVTGAASSPPGEERNDLRKGLDRLTETKRVVLLLAEVEGFTCEEIATMLSVPVGTVWTRLHHARREMRAFYAEGTR